MKARGWLWFVLAFALTFAACSAFAGSFPTFPFFVPQKPAAQVVHSTPDKITLYVPVDEVSAEEVIQQIQAANKLGGSKPIYLFINSPGGFIDAGGRILNAMKASKRPITTVCVSLCASMAAIIFEYGHDRQMMDYSTVMFHEASTRLEGSLSHIQSRLIINQHIVAEYEVRIAGLAKIPVDEFRIHELREWWVPADEAIAAHLCDSVVDFADYPTSKI